MRIRENPTSFHQSAKVVLGVAGDLAPREDGSVDLALRLLPGVSQVSVSSLKIAGRMDATKAAEAVAALLTRYRDNITGELTRAPFTRVGIPVVPKSSQELLKALRVTTSDPGVKFTISANAIKQPVRLGSFGWLVDDTNMIVLAQLVGTEAAPPTSASLEQDFARIRFQVLSQIESQFGAPNHDRSWIAVRKDLISTIMNAAVAQANVCVSANGSTRHASSSKIPMPSGDGVDCSSNRDCESSRRCTFSKSEDTRDCSACILSRPRICAPRICVFGGCTGGGCTGGGCIQRGNDPICEASKATQNTIYLADANARKIDCDRLRAMETAGCQAEEAGKKALCETGKAALNALKRTGNFANLDVDADLNANGMSICLKDFALTPGLDHVQLVLDVSGKAKASVGVKFTPLALRDTSRASFPGLNVALSKPV